MKTQLSHILPVWKACEILGAPTIQRIVLSLYRLRQSTSKDAAVPYDMQEMEALTESLFYKDPDPEDPLLQQAPPPPPGHVAEAWKKWLTTKQLALDKNTLLAFIVPNAVQPHTGPSGHMGLFDCWIYAWQGHSPSSQATYYGGASQHGIWLPDILILLAICKEYHDYQERVPTKEEVQSQQTLDDDDDHEDERIVWTMALLCYRIYDSYQKKGTVARDTTHRFLTDVHGEDSYKEAKAQALLDVIFEDPSHSQGWLHATVSELQFCKRVLDTINPTTRAHLLLDWVSMLGCSMIPPEEIPPSVAAYLDTMDVHPKPVCDVYDLAEHRLYEIKRRFHSMVQTSSPIIEGDPMGSTDSLEGASQIQTTSSPKQAITQAAFCKTVSVVNEEMGSGGYLPEPLAKLVFCAVCKSDDVSSDKLYWVLNHVLQFGCMAVRHNSTQPGDSDMPLLRFLFHLFQLEATDDEEEDKESDVDKTILTRTQMARLLLHLLNYADFRRRADVRRSMDSDRMQEDSETCYDTSAPASALESMMVDEAMAEALKLMPKAEKKSNGKKAPKVSLKTLLDFALSEVSEKDQMTFEEFCTWNRATIDKQEDLLSRSRLFPVMLELRMMAAVLFGIPPTLASLEVTIIAEIERRHKYRYPQSDVSRRGPRGTIWYIIDSSWFKDWAELVKYVAGTAEDGRDGRGDRSSNKARGLGRINNAGLLAENGSLALRADIKWKQDYEILPPLAWSALQAWYDGGPPIHRSVVRYVATGSAASPHSARMRIPTENEIELYPYFVRLYLCDATSRGEARPFQQNYQLSRVSPIGVMLVQLCRELDCDPDAARLWVMGRDPETPEQAASFEDWILSTDMNIVDQRKRRGVNTEGASMSLLLELKDKESGMWPRGADGKDWTFKEKSVEEKNSDLGDGIVGLYNMGNTCYMNSAVQCLSHTPIFREYFTTKAYLKDINPTNPLGHQGQLSQVSAVLVNSLWKRFDKSAPHQPKRVTAPGSYALVNAPSLTPKTFKESLGKFNDHFAGNEQHDAQEVLAFLLGGLSEDLNRIMDKPYIEAPDSDGRPDAELADIWWSNHLKRELSIIVALFTGQYKSLLTCRSCKYQSARFEPFSFLQLPLPEDDHYVVSLVLYPLKEGADVLKYCLRVKNDGVLKDVLRELAKVLYRDQLEAAGEVVPETTKLEDGEVGKDANEAIYAKMAQDLAVVDMREGYIAKIAPNTWSLQDLQNKETGELPLLHVYELDPAADETGKPTPRSENDDEEVEEEKSRNAFLALAQRRTEVISREVLHPLAHRVFGTPLLLRVADLDQCSGKELYALVAKRLRNLVPKGAQRFLNNTGAAKQDSDMDSNGAEKKVHRGEWSATRTTTDMEEVAAGPLPRFGFRLRITSRDGRRCLSCPWYEVCVGCIVPDDDKPTVVLDGDSIVIDWHFAVDVATNGFGMRVNTLEPGPNQTPQARARLSNVPVKNHYTSGSGSKKGGPGGVITLEECLDAFAKEERIPEAYCSRCKDFRVQTKCMSLWRLPPVVIIHLKRFQFTQHMRRKLRDLVTFPVEGLDLSRIMAQEPAPVKEEPSSYYGLDVPSSDDGVKDTGRSQGVYDLYGVIHHQGALAGGHYVASLKSEIDGQWRLFNDAQIYEIHARDVVDASAYILFYIRRDVSKANLSDFWNVGEGQGVSEVEMNELLQGKADRCVIS